jgi:AcrR family transcriptional regulator
VARWTPDSADRLAAVALDLFDQHGFDNVTVQQIADGAQLTARTFFRHFDTKEDVLFADGAETAIELIDGLKSAPPQASARHRVEIALGALADRLEPDRAAHRRRARVIRSHPALVERELLKQHQIAAALVTPLAARSKLTPARAQALTDVGMVAFRVAYERWTTDRSSKSLKARISEALDVIALDLAT